MQIPRSISTPIATLSLLTACAGNGELPTDGYGRVATQTEQDTLDAACIQIVKAHETAQSWLRQNDDKLSEVAEVARDLNDDSVVSYPVIASASEDVLDFCDNMQFTGENANVVVFDLENPIPGCDEESTNFCYVSDFSNSNGENIVAYSASALEAAESSFSDYILGQADLYPTLQDINYIQDAYMLWWENENSLARWAATLTVRGNLASQGFQFSSRFEERAEACASGDDEQCKNMANDPSQLVTDHYYRAMYYALNQDAQFRILEDDCENNSDSYTCLLNSPGYDGWNWDQRSVWDNYATWNDSMYYNGDAQEYGY